MATEHKHSNGESIVTERLRLQPSTLGEIDALLNRDPVQFESLICASAPEPFEPPPETADALGMFRGKLANDPTLSPWLLRWIIDGDNRRLIGSAGFIGPPDEFSVIQMGYSVYLSDQRKGYATEAVNGLIAWAFQQADVLRIQAAVRFDNLPSKRVVTKTGFTLIGEIDTDSEGLMGLWELFRPRG
jgi:ribosomal-protein-alanine N-acetyltransferase